MQPPGHTDIDGRDICIVFFFFFLSDTYSMYAFFFLILGKPLCKSFDISCSFTKHEDSVCMCMCVCVCMYAEDQVHG
jgi:hypothetical protein